MQRGGLRKPRLQGFHWASFLSDGGAAKCGFTGSSSGPIGAWGRRQGSRGRKESAAWCVCWAAAAVVPGRRMISPRKTGDKKKKKKDVKRLVPEKKKTGEKNKPLKQLTSEAQQQRDEPELKKQKLEDTKQERDKNEDGQELSPEEKRILERKLKKQRKKEQKKILSKAGTGAKNEEPKKPPASQLALDYLASWSENAKEWKFQKTRQTWLLLHMYDKDKVPDKYFPILLQYLEGLRGSARDLTVQKAEALMKEYDHSEAEDSALLEKCERIRKVLQLLS
uniref:Chromosome 7 open reading frame 50 n=1 Tax=Salvator merianae TaxID=96440 RepID=A0A8D0E4Q2_SALMN